MSHKVFPIFDRRRKSKKSSQDEDDESIVYLGEHISKNSFIPNTKSNSDTSIKSNLKSDSNTEGEAIKIEIKKETLDRSNISDVDIFQYYSQEQDSVSVDEDTVFHNSFANPTEENKEKQSSILNETEDEEDEDIKLIYDSRDLIEQICRKYDSKEPKQEKILIVDHSPILIKEKEKNEKIEKQTIESKNVLPKKDTNFSDDSKEKKIISILKDSDDSDLDILLCSIGDNFEKKKKDDQNEDIIECSVIDKSDSFRTKQGLEVKNNFQNLKISKPDTLQGCLFGEELDSLSSSSSEDERNQDEKFKNKFSSRTPSKPPVLAKTVANQHSEIRNSSLKRTILIEDTVESMKKKQKFSNDTDESLFSYIEKPPISLENVQTDDYEGLNEIDAKKKELLKNIRKGSLLNNPIKKSNSAGITNKKSVELMMTNKFKKISNVNTDCSFGLTQGINLAMQENLIRINQSKAKIIEKSTLTTDSSNQNEIKNQSSNISNVDFKKVRNVEKSSAKEKENDYNKIKNPNFHNSSEKPQSTTNDVVGDILNQMNNQNIQNKLNERKEVQDEFIFENFLFRVLKCSFYWLSEQDKHCMEKKYVAPPPVVKAEELEPLIDNYLSYNDYYKTMFPLLLSETWEDIFKDWKEYKNEIKTYQNSPIYLKSVDKVSKHQGLMAITFQILINGSLKVFPVEDDLLRLTLNTKVTDSNDLVSSNDLVPSNYFAIVRNSKKLKLEDTATMNCVKESVKKTDDSDKQKAFSYTESSPAKMKSVENIDSNKYLSVHEFCVYIRLRSYVTSPGLKVDYQVITSLSSSFRRAKSLIAFQASPLLKTILNVSPLDSAFWFNKDPNEKDLKFNFLNEYNESQQKVILQCSSIIKYEEPKLYFIQGPPGTGKSHTIVGIINAIFSRLNYYRNIASKNPNISESFRQKISNFRLLICSPSNGGCDELTRRIKKLKEKKNSSIHEHEMRRECNIVRVGRVDGIHKDCEDITLEFSTRKLIEQLTIEKKSAKSESLSSHYKTLQAYEKKITDKIKTYKSGHREKELKEAEYELEELKKRIKKFQDQLAKNRVNDISYGERKKIEAEAKEKVLKNADIIISTLNFSGNSLMDCLAPHKNNGLPQISVIIIDEAAQCLEVETLIPLRFGCDKIIQVGDPEQLPATVLSKLAQDRGFGMSMFERIYQRFRLTDNNPIQMLYVQYRMHQEICAFPSLNFYKGKLKTSKDTVQKRSIVDLKPYLFFNVLKSQEIGDEINGSVYNPTEGEHIIDYCKYLSGKYYKFSLGIITPYQKQSSYLKEMLLKNNLPKVEVGTVDGYQGREKDIIIFSSVRARNENKTIGFLAHRQRLNVALTRAKYAFYIFCHAESLIVNKDWKSCIEDAKKRNLIFNLE